MYFNPSVTLVFEFQLLARVEGFYVYGTLKYIYDFTLPGGP